MDVYVIHWKVNDCKKYISLIYEYAYHYQPNIVKHVKNEYSHFEVWFMSLNYNERGSSCIFKDSIYPWWITIILVLYKFFDLFLGTKSVIN